MERRLKGNLEFMLGRLDSHQIYSLMHGVCVKLLTGQRRVELLRENDLSAGYSLPDVLHGEFLKLYAQVKVLIEQKMGDIYCVYSNDCASLKRTAHYTPSEFWGLLESKVVAPLASTQNVVRLREIIRG